jgi:hypothetical protein
VSARRLSRPTRMQEKCRELRSGQAKRTEFERKREEALRREKGREEGGTRREDAHGGVVSTRTGPGRVRTACVGGACMCRECKMSM